MIRENIQKKLTKVLSIACLLFFLTGCETNTSIITNVDEKEANLIIVLLESHGISAVKERTSSGAETGGETTGPKFQINVPDSKELEALSLLNQNGFPRKKGTNLLELFAKQGLMTSDKEETIRYQAGLAQQITNTILMFDGVIDASVQLSFPPEETALPGGQQEEKQRITAAIYVKHQGAIDDPNLHLENKIKRLVSGSISGLDINDVTVVADRSRFTEIAIGENGEMISPYGGEYVKIWDIVMNKNSTGKFRTLFFFLTFFVVLFALALGWVLWKIYPTLRNKGLRELIKPAPLSYEQKKEPSDHPPNL